MNPCTHSNPASHRYCVICGSPLKRQNCPCCGALCDEKHLFCHACGHSLKASTSTTPTDPAPVVKHTYDLQALIQSATQTNQHASVKIEKTAGKMTQDEIKKLLAARQKKK